MESRQRHTSWTAPPPTKKYRIRLSMKRPRRTKSIVSQPTSWTSGEALKNSRVFHVVFLAFPVRSTSGRRGAQLQALEGVLRCILTLCTAADIITVLDGTSCVAAWETIAL